MKGLTFWRPWPSAILSGLPDAKDCENRGTPPPERLLGQFFALHAGQTYRIGEWAFPGGWKPPPAVECPVGIVGVARLVGFLDLRVPARPRYSLAPGFGTPEARRLQTLDQSGWWTGPVGLLLDHRTAIDVVPCKGAMGWWTVPPALEALVRQRAIANGAPL